MEYCHVSGSLGPVVEAAQRCHPDGLPRALWILRSLGLGCRHWGFTVGAQGRTCCPGSFSHPSAHPLGLGGVGQSSVCLHDPSSSSPRSCHSGKLCWEKPRALQFPPAIPPWIILYQISAWHGCLTNNCAWLGYKIQNPPALPII